MVLLFSLRGCAHSRAPRRIDFIFAPRASWHLAHCRFCFRFGAARVHARLVVSIILLRREYLGFWRIADFVFASGLRAFTRASSYQLWFTWVWGLPLSGGANFPNFFFDDTTTTQQQTTNGQQQTNRQQATSIQHQHQHTTDIMVRALHGATG